MNCIVVDSVAVIGPETSIGKATVDALIKRNIQTKILVPDINEFLSLYPSRKLPGEVSAIEGNLGNNQAIAKTLEYVDTIFFCATFPYKLWQSNLIPAIQKIADLAATLQARLLYPGNIFNFGKIKVNDPIDEEYPQTATTEIGQLSIAIENRLARAAIEGASLTILRFPPIYGPAMRPYDFLFKIFHGAINKKQFEWTGNVDLYHDFLYSVDAGEALVKAAQEARAADALFHFTGPGPIKFDEFYRLVYHSANYEPPEDIYIAPSSLKSKIISMVNRQSNSAEATLEQNPVMLDSSKFKQIVGKMEKTSHMIGVEETIEWMFKK